MGNKAITYFDKRDAIWAAGKLERCRMGMKAPDRRFSRALRSAIVARPTTPQYPRPSCHHVIAAPFLNRTYEQWLNFREW